MRFPRQLMVVAALLTWGLDLGIPCATAQGEPTIQQLSRQLQDKQTTDQALTELLKFGNADASARQYLAVHLPALIDADPRDRRPNRHTLLRPEWCNAAQLAGGLKLVEAAPALAKWIGVRTGNLVTLSTVEGLTNSPAGTALVQIGDPAIPALRQVLEHDTRRTWRSDAAFALILINSQKSKSVLRDYAARAPDRQLGELIRDRLETAASHEPE
jgi:hypothetical protein